MKIQITQNKCIRFCLFRENKTKKSEDENEKNEDENVQLLKFTYTLNENYTNGKLNLSL